MQGRVGILGCLLCIACVPEVSSTVTWGLAAASISCTAYCNNNDEACVPGHWPKNAFDMLRVAVTVENMECVNVTLSSDAKAPYAKTVGDETVCVYNNEVGTNMPSCSAASDDDSRRFCACAQVGLQWFVADKGQSCTDACHARGGICGDEDSVWPTTDTALDSIASYAGITCHTKEAGANSFNPSQGDDDTCYYGSSSQKPFCSASDWTNARQKRICPCWDAQNSV